MSDYTILSNDKITEIIRCDRRPKYDPKSQRTNQGALYILLLKLSMFFLIPMYIMIAIGFKNFDQVIVRTKWELPKGLHYENFIMFISYQAILIPMVQSMNFPGLYDGVAGLALAHIINGIPITS